MSKAIPAKSPLPILENFLFDLKGNALEITASDTELTLRTQIEVESISEEGKIAVPAKHLMDLLKELRKIEIPYNNQVIRFTMTVGAEECGGEDIEKTINAADNKLYMGKESGRDKVVC